MADPEDFALKSMVCLGTTMRNRDDRLESLRSNDAGERSQVMATLVTQGDQQAIAALADALLKSHWPACDQLADALAQIGTDEARRGLMGALKGRRHHIRSAAVKALARVGGESVRCAVAALAEDPAYEVRQDVAEALRQIGRKVKLSEES
jgi:HEAT repeat protein